MALSGNGGSTGPSITDVSRAASVSISTVSHVLNGTRFVSPVLRERVERAIVQLDYRHNGLARSLRTRRTCTIGLIIPDVTNPYYPQLARGVQDAADAAGYTVFLCNSDRKPENDARLIAVLEERRVDGVILDASGPSAELDAALRRRAQPMVLVGSRVEHADLDVIRMAPHGGYAAVRHLLQRGHRRIGLIGGPPAVSGELPAKAGGYLAAIQEAGMAVDPALLTQGGYTRDGGRTALKRLLALPAGRRPTAVFAGNDLMAIGALLAAGEASLCVPTDLAIIGYDDIPEAAVTRPALTTVAVPKYEMGRAAAELLLKRVTGEGPPTPQQVELPHALVIRESA